ncbi:unnamed protein product [Meloidogyne enterolobii]|uniref:Uncharacterized protein n=1 Tax=Meloidogyne enterolobii TaxID=390850 RepID=A0ACB1AH43_MELEN
MYSCKCFFCMKPVYLSCQSPSLIYSFLPHLLHVNANHVFLEFGCVILVDHLNFS